MSKRRLILITSPIIVLCTIFILFWLKKPSAEEVMADFYAAEGRAEDMLMDPLILNSDIVAPIVIQEIKNSKMDKRRYAISFLGNERIEESLPVLRTILADITEKDYFRADALESIYQINNIEGLDLAKKYSKREDILGYIANGLLDGSYQPYQRTYWQALTGHHE